jgi:hypothetical protein
VVHAVVSFCVMVIVVLHAPPLQLPGPVRVSPLTDTFQVALVEPP